MAHDVFLSHSVKDKAVAEAIVARLEAGSVTCWIAPRDVLPGADWGESIIDAIESSRIMVLLFSQSANASPQIKREVERAVNKGLYIIPFRLEDIPPARALEYFYFAMDGRILTALGTTFGHLNQDC
jgi:TIR domain